MKKWYILVYGNGNRTIMEESEYWKEQKENYEVKPNDPNHYDEALKGIVEAEHEPTWDDLEYDEETGTYLLRENFDFVLKGIVEAEHELDWDDFEYDEETGTYLLREN